MSAQLIFDIETVPDPELGRSLYGLDDLDDGEVMRAMQHHYQQRTGLEFLPPIQHKVVAIGVVLRNDEGVRPLVLGDEDAKESELIMRFFRGLGHYVPDLVTWNGAAFDLPVLNFRALRYEVQAKTYWETGINDRAFRFNNYLSRFHWRHTDLMDALSGFQGRGRPSLREACALLGLPGKNLMDGSSVMGAYLDGKIGEIRRYCLEDALNTYLVFLHFQFLRGKLTQDNLDEEYGLLIDVLKVSSEDHLKAFAGKLEAEADGPEEGAPGKSSSQKTPAPDPSPEQSSDRKASAPDPSPEQSSDQKTPAPDSSPEQSSDRKASAPDPSPEQSSDQKTPAPDPSPEGAVQEEQAA